MKLRTQFVDQRATTGRFWLSLAAFIASPFAIGLATRLSEDHATASVALLVTSVAVMIASGFGLTGFRRTRTGAVEVTKEGVDFAGSRLPREKIVSATYTPAVGRRPPSVRLVGRRERELGWVAVDGHEQGDQVLASLGLAPSQTSAEFFALAPRGSNAATWMWLAIALGLGLAALAAWATGIAQLAMLGVVPILAASAYLMPAKVHVGSDGLLYEVRLGSRFFPWSEVLGVEPIQKGVAVLLKNGDKVEIPTVSRGKMYYEYERVAQAALVSRANDALAAFERGEVPDVSTRVARLGRTKEEWIAQLRDREGGFRDAPLRSEDLWRIVESPAAEVTARAGAAAVLAKEATDEDRTRLRVAAETCAEPRLRVVLDKAASGEDVMDVIGDVDDEARDERAATAP